jgi:hypothetical protein
MNGLLTLYMGNDMALELQDLTDAVTDTVQSNATVTVTLQDESGVSVSGQTWPATMAAVVGTPGAYRVTLPAALAVIAEARYIAVIGVVTSGNVHGRWEAPVVASTRTA